MLEPLGEAPLPAVQAIAGPCRPAPAAVAEVGREDEKGLEQGDRKHSDDHDRQGPPELADLARDQQQREECEDVGQDGEDHRRRNLPGALHCGAEDIQPTLAVLVDVLADHNRVVDHNPQGDKKAEQRDHVDAHPEPGEDDQAGHEGQGHPRHNPQGQPILEEKRQDRQDNDHREGAVLEEQG